MATQSIKTNRQMRDILFALHGGATVKLYFRTTVDGRRKVPAAYLRTPAGNEGQFQIETFRRLGQARLLKTTRNVPGTMTFKLSKRGERLLEELN